MFRYYEIESCKTCIFRLEGHVPYCLEFKRYIEDDSEFPSFCHLLTKEEIMP